jgi:hypothetical protein
VVDCPVCRVAGLRGRICKRFRSPRISYKESIPLAYVACRAGTSYRVVVPARQAGNRLLGSLKGFEIRAQGWFSWRPDPRADNKLEGRANVSSGAPQKRQTKSINFIPMGKNLTRVGGGIGHRGKYDIQGENAVRQWRFLHCARSYGLEKVLSSS